MKPHHYIFKKAKKLLLLVALFLTFIASASTLPDGFAEVRLLTGLDPTAIEVAPDGRLFVIIKSGKVFVYKNNALLATPLLSINVDKTNERGIQSITLDPSFSTNGFFYVYYTVPGQNRNRVSRFTANGDVAAASSELVLLDLDVLKGSVHNGGSLFFKDGKLFITTGEGSDAPKSQSFTSLLGKVLRINPNGTIPADNPFVSSTTGKYQSIYALGFRNPFKATVQRTTGKIFVNDVGGASWEEINDLVAGKNYGWPTIEGKKTTQTAPANYVDPVFVYGRSNGCSITGCAFYNPVTSQFPAKYVGKYFFQDYCGNYIKVLDLSTFTVQETFATGLDRPIDIEVSSDGSLYYMSRGGIGGGSQQDNESSSDGEVWKVNYTGGGAPSIAAQPQNTTVTVGGSTSFVVSASGNGPLSYQWQKNNVNIAGATSATYAIAAASISDNGAVFKVIVSNSLGSITSNGAVLNVINDAVPVPTITTPLATAKYSGGQVINFSGTATDEEDGELPESAFTWEVRLYHDEHFHPAQEATTGSKSGSYTVATSGETSSNVWYRILLTVKDSKGQSTQIYRDVFPNKAQITLTTNPVGLSVKLDGTTYTTPYIFTGVVGIVREIEAVTPQVFGSVNYEFSAWSDAKAVKHEIITPSTNTTYTATYAGELRNPENPVNTVSGVNYSYYEGNWTALPNFNALTAIKTGNTPNFNLSSRNVNDFFAFSFTGYITVPTDGIYTFFTRSDDGSKLFIGSTEIVNNDNLHGSVEKSGKIGLKAGTHIITVTYFERTGSEVLDVSYSGPGITKALIPTTALSRINTSIKLTNNLALNKAVTVSSTQSANLQASNAVDGNIETRWSTEFNDNQWIYIDLENTYSISDVKLVWEAAYARDYKIQVTDNPNDVWTDLKTVTGNTTLVNNHINLSGSGRYLRIIGTARGTVYGYSIFELEVYGSNVSGKPSSTINADLEKETVVLYPNPTFDTVHVEAKNIKSINVYNFQGSIVKKSNNKVDDVDLTGLEPGIYTFEIQTDNNTYRKKIIKK